MFSFIQTASENLDGLIFNIWSLGSWFSMRSPAPENLNDLSYMSYLISRIYRDIYCYVPMFPRVISYVSSIDSKKTHFGVMKYSLSTLCRNYPCSISRYKRVISKMKVSEMNFQFIFYSLITGTGNNICDQVKCWRKIENDIKIYWANTMGKEIPSNTIWSKEEIF